MATWSHSGSNSNEDARQAGAIMTLDDAPLVFDAGNQWWGFIFVSGIPRGATITSAYMTVYVTSTSYDTPGGLVIYGQLDAGSVAVFTTTDNDITSRTRTTASVAWSDTNIGTGDKNTPDLSAILQEIVNQPGYAPTQRVAFLWDALAVTDFRVRSIDSSLTTCARITAEYVVATSLPPIRRQRANLRR